MYLVEGRTYLAGSPNLQGALAAAYERRHGPSCLCSGRPAPLYITRHGGAYALKRFPFTADLHSPDCVHSAPSSFDGRPPPEAVRKDALTGLTEIRVGFALSSRAFRGEAAGIEAGPGTPTSIGRSRLSLRGLVHLLWQEAELTRWQPGFAGKRTWAVVRWHLLRAASAMRVTAIPLTRVLYVPEVFSARTSDSIRRRREQHLSNGFSRGPHAPRMILIGEMKNVVRAGQHFHAAIKHLPDQPFLLSADLRGHVERQFKSALAFWKASGRAHLILGATFTAGNESSLILEEACLMVASEQWLPVTDSDHLAVVARLVDERRSFDSAKYTRSSEQHARSPSLRTLSTASASPHRPPDCPPP